MATVSTTIKLDPLLKQEAQELFEELGMNLSSAVNVFLRQCIRARGIPFYISLDESYLETKKAIEDAHNGIGMEGPFDTVEEMMEALDAEG